MGRQGREARARKSADERRLTRMERVGTAGTLCATRRAGPPCWRAIRRGDRPAIPYGQGSPLTPLARVWGSLTVGVGEAREAKGMAGGGAG